MSGSLADPQGSSAIGAAVLWLQGTLLGSIAVAVAVVAVASVGLMMLGGRIDLRRGMIVIAGCFVLFGAPTIAGGIQSILNGVDESIETAAEASPPVPPPPALPPTPTSTDPYAGASVPVR
jgi:type IV secretory pathway VirB2 component (pilin)